jgi:hypothetical protein
MTGQRDDQEKSREHDVDREHDLSLQQASRASGEDESRKEQARVHIAGDLRGESGNDQQDVRTLQRNEDSEHAPGDRQERIRTKLGLQVVVLAAPGEPGKRNSPKQDDLERREADERHADDDRDDLGHANTVVGTGWAFGAEYWKREFG